MPWRQDKRIDEAIAKLGEEFPSLRWDFSPDPDTGRTDLVSHWLGDESEEVMVNVFQGRRIDEQFHRQDFFFLHFAWRGDYDALSAEFGGRVTVCEGSCYIGQPYSGYAAQRDADDECTIVGVLVKRDVFVREYLGALAADADMLTFFLEPQKDRFSDVFVLMEVPEDSPAWPLLGLMAYEYAHKTECTQRVLKPMLMSLAMYLSAEYKRQHARTDGSLADRIVAFIEANSDTATLASIAAHFGYHPVYVSRYVKERTGRTFSEHLAESRMHRARLLLDDTDLPVERVALMVGYGNTSNFYKAFRRRFGTTPRQRRSHFAVVKKYDRKSDRV